MALLEGLRWSFLIEYPLIILLVMLKVALLIPLFAKWRFPLSHVPGPWLARWSRLWLVRSLVSGKAAHEFVRLDLQYGPVIRTGPNHILISDPETTRRILAVGSKYKRGPWFDALRLDPTRTNVISERDPKKHQDLRHVLGSGIAGKGVANFESIMDDHIRGWIRMIDRKHVSTEDTTIAFDVSRSVPLLAIDLISHLCLGESFGCVETERDQHEFLFHIRTGMIVQQVMSIYLEIKTILHSLAKIPFLRQWITLFPAPSHRQGIGRVLRIIQLAVEKRQREQDKQIYRGDMLDSFLERGLDVDQSLTELCVVLASNTDNASSAIQGILFGIVTHPSVYINLQKEVDSVATVGDIAFPISDTDARKLPYLQACISEGLRRYPPEMQLRERVVPPQGDAICGYHIPGGTYVGFNALATQCNTIYGKDFEEFRPARWLIEDEERLRQMHKTLELVFSYGTAKCLGYTMAYMEMNKVVFEIFRHFDISLSNPLSPWKRRSRGSFVQSEFCIRVQRRHKS
ncbi:cytochrome P450 oxidoreductase [Massariosphaeria phaeospora]|uniref:Cytochrome P450 oxidoreductase n=1 Tax=Massariosphaeria phaeospora TaxID=100035 RepID=A0A7C8IE91_9PLEO|nr:cytochrome P450 oxidoreductase [Massariosphaeria phaeospora]